MAEYRVELTDEQAQTLLKLWDGYDSEDLDHGLPPGSRRSVIYSCKAAVVDAVRANPPKPPRMTEPGWGEIVTACIGQGRRRRFVRVAGEYPWTDEDGDRWRWNQLIDPEPIP